MRDRHLSGTPAPTPQWGLSPPPFPSDRRTQPQFHLALWDLDDAQLQKVLSEVCLETARREVEAPLVGLPVSQEDGPGRGANPGMIAGEVPLPEERGWGPSGQGLWPTGTPQTEEDVGCLISTLAARLQMGTPRINTFSGDGMLGKTEVSFEQWYQKVQYIKDHYLESVVQESIVRSLKGAAVDMAQYMGPNASIAHILQKLAIIFSTMASFDVMMQTFTVTQGNHEKIPSFTTRLEGTLNQIRLQYHGRMSELEVQRHLKDCLFHGVHKHIEILSDISTVPMGLFILS